METTFLHKLPFSVINLHNHLPRRASLKRRKSLTPNPPWDTGCLTMFHPTGWYLKSFPKEPQRRFLWIASNSLARGADRRKSKDSKCYFDCDCCFGCDMKKSLYCRDRVSCREKKVLRSTQKFVDAVVSSWIDHILNLNAWERGRGSKWGCLRGHFWQDLTPLFDRYLNFHPESHFSEVWIISSQIEFSLNFAPRGRPR